jgi:flagellar basal-body rod protein FlgF
MSDGLYVGMNGAAARAMELESIADNLANANTPAFKAQRPAFAGFLAAEQGGSKGAIDQVHPAAVSTALDMRLGLTMPTNRNLDVVPRDDTFLGVVGPDGRTVYTRRGALNVNGEGQLSSLDRPVIGQSGGPITIPMGQFGTAQGLGQRVFISEEGYVRVGDVTIDRLALFQLSGPIDRLGTGLVAPGAGGTAVPTADVRVQTGALEQSNVNALETTVSLINAQRQFENAMQALNTYRRMDDKMNEAGRVR